MHNLGGGGGGCPGPSGPDTSLSGGSGVVVIRYQIGQQQAAAPRAKATGGAISLYNNYVIHTFVNSGDFNTSSAIPSAEVVIVGGGGAGGLEHGAGGGAGGMVYHSSLAFPLQHHTPLLLEQVESLNTTLPEMTVTGE